MSVVMKKIFGLRYVPAPVVIVLVMLAAVAGATDYTSTNFISRDPVIDSFGGFSSGAEDFNQLNCGGQTVIGESTSSNFVWRAGFCYFTDYTVLQRNWRWYDDETSETPATALAAENTTPSSVQNGNAIKLRVTLAELAGISSPSQKYRLQFSTQADFSSDVNDVVASASCGGSSKWCYTDGVDDDNDVITTDVLSDSDDCTGGSGDGCGTHNESGAGTSTFLQRFNAAMEMEFTIKPSGPQPETVYYFRTISNTASDPVPLDIGKTFPSLTADAASLSFQVLGVDSGTSTEGVTTDVTTTSTTITFGTLVADTETEAAQKLLVNTNAPSGYTVYLFRDNSFKNPVGDDMEDVSGTNASPAAWGIPIGQTSAFGYHSSDSLLGTGTTTRFSADDTYATLDGTAREVVFNSGSVVDEETDIVYKIEVEALHPSGLYETSLEYIIVPIF